MGRADVPVRLQLSGRTRMSTLPDTYASVHDCVEP